jgi:F-box protein 18 (helicase)
MTHDPNFFETLMNYPSALCTLRQGKPILKAPKKYGAGIRNGAGAAAGTLVVRGAAAVHGLLNVLLEAPGGDPGVAESAPRDAPSILAPVPFANATLRRATLKLARSQVAAGAAATAGAAGGAGVADSGGDGVGGTGGIHSGHTGGVGGGSGLTRVVYTAECVPGAPLPPWCVARLLEVLCDEQSDDVLGTFRTLAVSGPLNAAMGLAAAGNWGGATPGVQVVAAAAEGGANEVKAGGYYTEPERRRVAAAMAVGHRGMEKVERTAGGRYHVQSMYD